MAKYIQRNENLNYAAAISAMHNLVAGTYGEIHEAVDSRIQELEEQIFTTINNAHDYITQLNNHLAS